MTIQELKDAVAKLGFEDELEDDKQFYLTVNRCIYQVSRVRPTVATLRIDHFPIKNQLNTNASEPQNYSGKDLLYGGRGVKAYYFEADGNGTAILERFDEDTQEWVTTQVIALVSNRKFKAYKGFVLNGEDFIDGKVRLKFNGGYSYNVRNVAFYEVLTSGSEDDVPTFEAYSKYDCGALVDDFHAFDSRPVIDELGQSVELNYKIEGKDKLLLPREKSGSYIIKYERKHKQISDADELAVEIDLDDDLCAILPNLCASYILADTEPLKAEYYLVLYREQVQEIVARTRNIEPIAMKSCNNW